MTKEKVFVLLLIFFLLANLSYAATIYGTVYDLSLNKVGNARIEINTAPKQFMIAKNGTYSFDAQNGNYLIKAKQIQKSSVIASAEENITIKQSGSYVLDIILFPDVEEGIEDIGIEVNGTLEENNYWWIIDIAILLIIAASIYVILKKKNKKFIGKNETTEDKTSGEKSALEDADINKIVEILKKESGRATQKDIRKEIPLSEAKISLMIAELEHKGVVEKIKKGRGNIIILKR